MAGLAERIPEATPPLSFQELPKDKVLSSVQKLQFRLSTVIIGMKEFQEAYRTQVKDSNLEWSVEFEAHGHKYKVNSILIPEIDRLAERTLDVTRTHSLSRQMWDLDDNLLSNPGPFVEEHVILVMSDEKPIISYSKKRSDRPSPDKEYKNREEAENEISHFINISTILSKELQNEKKENSKQKITPAPSTNLESRPKSERELKDKTKRKGFLSSLIQIFPRKEPPEFEKQEKWARENNPTYRASLEEKKRETREWEKRLKEILKSK